MRFTTARGLRGFVGIELNRDPVPDATTVLHFRHWLERHDLAKALFDEVGTVLEERGLLMRQGTIVDATIIADAGYTGADKRPEHADREVSWNIAIKRSIIKALPERLRQLAAPVE